MDYQSYIEEFLYNKLKSAIINIEETYFTLDLANKEDENISIYRERSFCYELYHRLRLLSDCDYPFVITGEPDKRGHPILESGKNPDFIIHRPGAMNKNLIVVEVKTVENVKRTINNKDTGVNKDIETFKEFLKDFNYEAGVYLIFGEPKEDYTQNIEKIKSRIKKMLKKENINKKIYLILHNEPQTFPEFIELSKSKSKKL